MFTKELADLLVQVISSWQVIVVTIAMLLYISLIIFVARTRSRLRSASVSYKPKKKIHSKAPARPKSPEDIVNDELGLEEE